MTLRVEPVHPALTDPTAGYHSLSCLAGYAAAHGCLDVHIVDANVEAFHHTLSGDASTDVVEQTAARRQQQISRFAEFVYFSVDVLAPPCAAGSCWRRAWRQSPRRRPIR